MAKLPKALIKKYGISKKAWSVFRSRGHHTRTRKTAQVENVARRRIGRRARRSFGRATRNVRSGGRSFKPLMDAALGGATVGIVLKVAPQQYNTPTNRLLVGAAATYMGSGFIRDAGKVLIGMEVARMTSNLAGGMSGTATTTAVSQAVY